MNSINRITKLILIYKEHLLRIDDSNASPQNVIVSSEAQPTKINFLGRSSTFYKRLVKLRNGFAQENAIDLQVSLQESDVTKYFDDNIDREFVAFIRQRNQKTIIVGVNSGLEVSQLSINTDKNLVNHILGNSFDFLAVESEYDIEEFFIGRDFSNDFYIDFG